MKKYEELAEKRVQAMAETFSRLVADVKKEVSEIKKDHLDFKEAYKANNLDAKKTREIAESNAGQIAKLTANIEQLNITQAEIKKIEDERWVKEEAHMKEIGPALEVIRTFMAGTTLFRWVWKGLLAILAGFLLVSGNFAGVLKNIRSIFGL